MTQCPHPRAHSFDLYDCGEPNCGLHVISFDKEGRVLVETVMSPAQTLKMIDVAQKILYRKAVER